MDSGVSVMSRPILPLLWPDCNHNSGGADGYASHMKGSPSAVAIAANVKKVMQDRGLSQEALAKLSGVSKSAIGYLINYRDGGDRHAALDTVDALSRALGIPPAQLIAEAPSVSGAKARTLHVVAEQGSPYKA